MSPRMIEVGPYFPCERLPLGVECYFRLHGRMVMVRGAGTLALVFCRNGRLICDCPEAQAKGECRHTHALRAGLWARVFMCPQGHGIMTRTLDWLQRGVHRPVLLLQNICLPHTLLTSWPGCATIRGQGGRYAGRERENRPEKRRKNAPGQGRENDQ